MKVKLRQEVTEEEFSITTFGCDVLGGEFDLRYLKENNLKAIFVDSLYQYSVYIPDKQYIKAGMLRKYGTMYGFSESSFEKLFEITEE